MPSMAIGVGLACAAATMNATGLNLQRLAKRRGSAALNLLGVILATACGAVDMVALSFAPQSFLAPFGALSLVVNLLLAPLMHGDAIGTVDVVATSLAVSGIAVCLASSPPAAAASWTLEELLKLANGRGFHLWLCAKACAAALAGAWILRAPSHPSAAPCFSLLAGLLGGCTALCAKLVGELANAVKASHF